LKKAAGAVERRRMNVGIELFKRQQPERFADMVYMSMLESERECLDDVKTIDIQSLAVEVPDYVGVIRPKPDEVLLLESVVAVRDLGVLQPLFKVVCGIEGRRFLYIVGRDRHTREPFALCVPNGFVGAPIDDALRWTMCVYKGDSVKEV